MQHVLLLVFLAVSLVTASCGNDSLENGWVAYKNELYIKAFNTILTYSQAKLFCARQGNNDNHGSLLMIKESDLQKFVVNYTKGIADHIWLGGKYDNATAQFKWEDGDSLTFSNWLNGYPTNITKSQACIQFYPQDDSTSSVKHGKWAHAACRKRNLVMCQKSIPWTMEEAVRQILIHQKNLVAEKRRREDAERTLFEISTAIVPINSIYIQYYNQSSPEALWPMLRWVDITSEYAGLFFRALGADSENWGTTQVACAPRIVGMQYLKEYATYTSEFVNPLVFPPSGWSEYGQSGEVYVYGPKWNGGLRFNTSDCEVRPKNQAVKIWKRIRAF